MIVNCKRIGFSAQFSRLRKCQSFIYHAYWSRTVSVGPKIHTDITGPIFVMKEN